MTDTFAQNDMWMIDEYIPFHELWHVPVLSVTAVQTGSILQLFPDQSDSPQPFSMRKQRVCNSIHWYFNIFLHACVVVTIKKSFLGKIYNAYLNLFNILLMF